MIMRTRYLLPLLAAGVLSFTACDIEDFGGAHYTADYHQVYPLSADGKISVETFNGSIEVSGWDQDSVEISGTKYGSSQQLADDLEIRVDHAPASISIRAVRPSIHHGNQGAKFV